MRDTPEWPGRLIHRLKDPKGGKDSFKEDGIQKFVMK
jgi:hypothetical protein